MRILRSSLLLAVLIPAASQALAAEIAATSAVTAATLFPEGATVTRRAEFSAAAGSNEVVIDDLPLNFDIASLRVTGTGNTPFQVLSVDHSVENPLVDEPTSPERDKIEAEIETIEDAILTLEREKGPFIDRAEAANRTLKFIEELSSREPQKMVDEADRSGTNPDSWRSAISVIGSETADALSAKRKAREGMADIKRRIAEQEEEIARLRRKLDNIAPPPPVSAVLVRISSDQPVEGELAISYQIGAARWAPIYDLRLERGTDGEKSSLNIERRATVLQTTGEDWSGVALTLSTARPSQRMAAPRLMPRQAAIARARQQEMNAPAMSKRIMIQSNDADQSYRGNILAAQGSTFERDEASSVAADITESVAALKGQTVVYEIPGEADVDGNGTAKQLLIGARETKVELLARSAPALDATAYLYAKFENKRGGPILAGPASVFRDGAFIGETRLAFIASGDEHAIPFGAMDGLIVERRIVEKTESEEAGVAPHMRRVERSEMSVRSTLDHDVVFTFFDATPYSEIDKVEIKTTANPEPTETDVDNERGILAWTFTLPAGESKTVEAGHEINWPLGAMLSLR